MGEIKNIIGFVVICAVSIYIIKFIREQQIGWVVFTFVFGVLTLAFLYDWGGIQETSGQTVAEWMKNIATDAEKETN